MCEFKVLKKEKDSFTQIADEILVFNYDEETGDSGFYGIFGEKTELKNALVLEVNMMPSKHNITIIQSPLISDFVKMVKNLNNESVTKEEIEQFQNYLEEIKAKL